MMKVLSNFGFFCGEARRHLKCAVMNIIGPSTSSDRLISPPVETSLRPNFGSESLEQLRLDLSSPRRSRPGGQPPNDASPPVSTSEMQAISEYVRYQDVDSEQRVEFENLLKTVS